MSQERLFKFTDYLQPSDGEPFAQSSRSRLKQLLLLGKSSLARVLRLMYILMARIHGPSFQVAASTALASTGNRWLLPREMCW